MAHKIAKYFEIHRAKRAILLLIKPDKIRRELLPEERPNIKIKGATKTKRFDGKEKKTLDQLREETDRDNRETFFNKYPDMAELYINDQAQFDRKAEGRTKILNPDMTFCSFLISFGMFLLSLLTFYSHRDFTNEYFTRALIYEKMINPPERKMPYYNVSTNTDFE